MFNNARYFSIDFSQLKFSVIKFLADFFVCLWIWDGVCCGEKISIRGNEGGCACVSEFGDSILCECEALFCSGK